MKIVYAGLQYHRFDPSKGLSFEHNNVYEGLRRFPGAEIIYFPFERILERGKRRFNEEVLTAVKNEKPDVFFAFMLSDEFTPEILERIKECTTSIAWFADDSWRFYNYSRFWAPRFSWAVTTCSWAPELYRKIVQCSVLRSQWAATVIVSASKRDVVPDGPGVSFVGGWSRPRQNIIGALQRAGIDVAAYGNGWPNGRLGEAEMVRLFSTSKINLALNPAPGWFNQNSLGRLFFRRSVNRIVPDVHLWRNFESWLHRDIPQIKARHFEIPACGGFMITSKADDLQNYYKIGEEIAVYDSIGDLIDKIRYYLTHDSERETIAVAGHKRTIRDHTYAKRFQEIFKIIGLNYGR